MVLHDWVGFGAWSTRYNLPMKQISTSSQPHLNPLSEPGDRLIWSWVRGRGAVFLLFVSHHLIWVMRRAHRKSRWTRVVLCFVVFYHISSSSILGEHWLHRPLQCKCAWEAPQELVPFACGFPSEFWLCQLPALHTNQCLMHTTRIGAYIFVAL